MIFQRSQSLLGIGLAVGLVLWGVQSIGWSTPLATEPDLAAALPWADSDQGVVVTAPFLINGITIIPQGAVLRNFYVRPSVADDTTRFASPEDQRQQAYGRHGYGTGLPGGGPAMVPTQFAAAVKSAHHMVWPNIASFRAALDQIDATDLRMVYQEAQAIQSAQAAAPSPLVEAKEGKEIHDEALNFIEGLLLAEKNGAVTILAVVRESNADHAGMKAGDRLIAFDDQEVKGSLASFAEFYRVARSTSTITAQKPYRFSLQRDGKTELIIAVVKPPPALGGSLLDQ